MSDLLKEISSCLSFGISVSINNELGLAFSVELSSDKGVEMVQLPLDHQSDHKIIKYIKLMKMKMIEDDYTGKQKVKFDECKCKDRKNKLIDMPHCGDCGKPLDTLIPFDFTYGKKQKKKG